MYSHDVPSEALDFVDEHMNGEDLLFNYMVANATGMGPIRSSLSSCVVRAWSTGADEPPGCWRQSSTHGRCRSRIKITPDCGAVRVIWPLAARRYGSSSACLGGTRSSIRPRAFQTLTGSRSVADGSLELSRLFPIQHATTVSPV